MQKSIACIITEKSRHVTFWPPHLAWFASACCASAQHVLAMRDAHAFDLTHPVLRRMLMQMVPPQPILQIPPCLASFLAMATRYEQSWAATCHIVAPQRASNLTCHILVHTTASREDCRVVAHANDLAPGHLRRSGGGNDFQPRLWRRGCPFPGTLEPHKTLSHLDDAAVFEIRGISRVQHRGLREPAEGKRPTCSETVSKG